MGIRDSESMRGSEVNLHVLEILLSCMTPLTTVTRRFTRHSQSTNLKRALPPHTGSRIDIGFQLSTTKKGVLAQLPEARFNKTSAADSLATINLGRKCISASILTYYKIHSPHPHAPSSHPGGVFRSRFEESLSQADRSNVGWHLRNLVRSKPLPIGSVHLLHETIQRSSQSSIKRGQP